MRHDAVLYTFSPSHYCEKARWALDLGKLPYREVAWAPGLHVLLSRRLAPKTTVPILRTREICIQGSGAILDWIEAQGGAAWRQLQNSSSTSESKSLEAHADAVTGVAIRRLAYAVSLSTEPQMGADNLFSRIGPWQKPLARLMWPKTRTIMQRSMRAAPEDILHARDDVDRELTRLDHRLRDGRRFLVGDRLGRADIVVASLLAPIALPPEHPVYLAGAHAPALADAVQAWQTRPSMLWVKALYRDFRPARS